MKKMKLFSGVILLFFGASQPAYSQLAGANVTVNNPSYSQGISVNNNFTGANQDRIAVYASSVNNPGYGYGVQAYGGYRGVYAVNSGTTYSGASHGVYSISTGTAGSRYGVYASASGTGGSGRYGVYGYASADAAVFAAGIYGSVSSNTAANHWAGYFLGKVYASGGYSASDRKLKTDIAPLKNSLDKLMKLKPSVYKFKTTEYARMGLPEGNQLGLIADELKQQFPELVTQAVLPAQEGEDRNQVSPEDKFEAVNYNGLIPILIGSIQEQQKLIADLKKENQDLKVQFTKLEKLLVTQKGPNTIATPVTLSSATLGQNNPNPFNENTVVNYFLPEKAGPAFMYVSDASGRIIKTIPIIQKGNGQVVFKAGELSPGTYQYSLKVAGRLLDTKKMILTN